MYKAEILADSINGKNVRITTFRLVYPRIVHAEMLTHRVFSRNSSSSRAIPNDKLLQMIKSNFFMPIGFQKVHSGMQGSEYFQGEELIECQKLWQNAIETNIKISAEMTAFGITKQLANRWLEPAQYIEVILTGTDFDNFFNLRLHKDAEIHIYKIAEIMKSEMALSTPKKLKKGEWHIPNVGFENEPLSDKIKMTTAKLARTSFKTLGDDYKFTKNQDINLHDRLIKEGHFSPLEHCAENQEDNGRYFNFKGFKQYRQFVMNNELDKIK